MKSCLKKERHATFLWDIVKRFKKQYTQQQPPSLQNEIGKRNNRRIHWAGSSPNLNGKLLCVWLAVSQLT